MKNVLEYGISFSFHSDMPMAPAKPLQLVWAAVNRLTAEGQVVGPEHRTPLTQALKAIKLDAAYSIQQETAVGSIEVGKHANLTILEKKRTRWRHLSSRMFRYGAQCSKAGCHRLQPRR